MIWLTSWLVSIVPAILVTGFVLGRTGVPREAAFGLSLLAVCWPLLLPLLAIVWLVERAVLLGELARKADSTTETKP